MHFILTYIAFIVEFDLFSKEELEDYYKFDYEGDFNENSSEEEDDE